MALADGRPRIRRLPWEFSRCFSTFLSIDPEDLQFMAKTTPSVSPYKLSSSAPTINIGLDEKDRAEIAA
jgi:hypothetical protein